jgi:predicted nucleotidyltransferase
MNIHFKDDILFKQLNDATLVRLVIGSHTYGLNDESSDVDYLSVYVPTRNEKNSFSFTNHQLQFKDSGTDYNFVNLFNFIRNAINGDSTINFEFINNDALKGTCLEFLYNMRTAFNNYNIIRSYLGLSRRDLKQISIAPTERDKNKKLSHAARGYYFAKMIYDNKFSNKLNDIEHQKLLAIKNITDYRVRHKLTDMYSELINNFRKKINIELENGMFTKFMKVEDQILLDMHITTLINTNSFKAKEFEYMDLNIIYEANEKGVSYKFDVI